MDAIAGLRDGFLGAKFAACERRDSDFSQSSPGRLSCETDCLSTAPPRLGFKCAAHRILSNTLDKIGICGNFVRLHSTKS